MCNDAQLVLGSVGRCGDDLAGNVTRAIEPQGYARYFVHGPVDRATAQTNAAGAASYTEHDGNANVVAIRPLAAHTAALAALTVAGEDNQAERRRHGEDLQFLPYRHG